MSQGVERDSEYQRKMENVWIVLPAYNAEKTLLKTFNKIPQKYRNNVLLVDDASSDNTVEIATNLGLHVVKHDKNLGYGGNQKTCYTTALEKGAEIVIMLHPDNQYDPRVVGVMAELIALNNADVILGNRIRSRREALVGGMPKWRYFLNRSSTFVENLLLGQTIGDFHSGLRGYSRAVLEVIPFHRNRNSFAFDQELLIQAVHFNFRIADIPIPTKYESESSSISIKDSAIYGFFGATTILFFFLNKFNLKKDLRFRESRTI